MKRRLFNIISAISLVLCVAAAVHMVCSYWHTDFVSYTFATSPSALGRKTWCSVGSGRLHFAYTWEKQAPDYHADGKFFFSEQPWRPPEMDVIGAKYEEESPLSFRVWATGAPGSYLYRYADIPYWSVVVLFFIIPACWLFAKLRHMRTLSRHNQKLCVKCRYDLRAHNAGTPCPECGTLIPEPKRE